MGLSTGIGIGISFNRGGGTSWTTYWPSQLEVLFFGLYSEISGGQMPNKVEGSSDYLTVAGAAGSETYQCPNTAPYIAADTDRIWFYNDRTQRTTTTAELIGYDFTRAIIKYQNDSPYAIEAIMIFSSDVDTDKMRDDFDLSVWWDGTLSDHGNVKGNRGIGKSVWAIEYDTASSALFVRMTAVSETPTTARKNNIDRAIRRLKTASLFSTQFDCLVVTRGHGNDSSLLNWIADAKNGLAVNTPVFTEDVGYNSDGAASYINSQYNPSASSLLLQNDACFIKKTSGTLTTGKYSGATDGASHQMYFGTSQYQSCNDAGKDTALPAAVGWNCLSRNAVATFSYMRNDAINTITVNSSNRVNLNLFIMAYNSSGSAGYWAGTGEIYELYAMGKYISQANFLVFQGIFNDFFTDL